MDEVTITRHATPTGGEYHAHVPGSSVIGRLTWVRHGNVHVADHTIVPPAIGGRGIAGQLVEALVADARAARTALGWQPRYLELDTIVAHAWSWEQRRAQVL